VLVLTPQEAWQNPVPKQGDIRSSRNAEPPQIQLVRLRSSPIFSDAFGERFASCAAPIAGSRVHFAASPRC
jgi:hypothetical protein